MTLQNALGDITLEDTQLDVREATQTVAGAIDNRDSPVAADQPGIPALVMRHDADSAVVADNDLALPHVDEEGRLKVATKPGSFSSIVGTANTVAATVIADVSRASNIVFHVKNVGAATIAAGTFIFEASLDSTNGTDGVWFGIQAVRSNANTVETQIALTGIAVNAGYAAAWEASVNAYKWIRIRCSVAVTATASAQWTIQRGSYATEPIPAAQVSATQAVSGSVTVSGTVTATPGTGTGYYLTAAATTNLTSVFGSAGRVVELTLYNPTASTIYFKLYNKATAPVLASDVPLLVIPVAANGYSVQAFGTTGKQFTLGIAFAITGAQVSTDTTAVAAGVMVSLTRA